MLCKWCGAAVPKDYSSCPRCSRDIPPLSDCGGFYDLVPAAKEVIPVGTPKPPEQPPKTEKPTARDKRMQKNIRLLVRVACATCVVACLFCVITVYLALRANRQLSACLDATKQSYNALQEINQKLKDLTEHMPETNAPDPTEPTPPETDNGSGTGNDNANNGNNINMNTNR